MAKDAAVWITLRRVFWAVAASLLIGAIIYAYFGSHILIGCAVVVAAAALSAGIGERQPPKTVVEVPAQNDLHVLPPLSREMLERLPDPLMLVNGGDRVFFANRAMRDVIGVGIERKHISAVLRNPSILEALARTSQTGEPGSVDFVVRVPIERNYQAFTARVSTEPSIIMLLMHDLTSIKRTEQMRVDFIANASHELRTPLAAVAGFIETLKGPARDDEEAREKFLDIMAVEAERMRRLIEDLLSLTRIELNEHVPPRGEVALEEVIRQASAALSPLAKADGISIVVEAAPDLPRISGERDELVQLFQNLIHNAIKYGRERGEVKIALKQQAATGRRGPEAFVIASVKDDGEGIPAEAIPRLTERFYRVDVKRSRERGGTGLGLAIVKHIVNRHNGKMQIESRVGEGSTFTITLPALKKQTDASVTELL
ncbi:two-component system phosphate regulon sensor histidine kinase PhoR [Rhizomicrobium palustre]|uniref:histidine kinase n=1 Tax=Rhizomicrobium palustre TaxID=189966 RepID=A0A846N0J5_9PROT|nr:ATP-binding protein [Rhizomicrobium palustre]NIK89019.1 two-component system phosphate regulon sensor histidine kinase PhoR [Rhizomicrobium palustre]